MGKPSCHHFWCTQTLKLFFYSSWGMHLHPVHPPAYATGAPSQLCRRVCVQWRLGSSTGCGGRHRGSGRRRSLDETLLAGGRRLRRILLPAAPGHERQQSVVRGVLAATLPVLHQRLWPRSQIRPQTMHWSVVSGHWLVVNCDAPHR